MIKLRKLGCACEKPSPNYTEYRSSELGTDHTDNRDAEVSFQQCRLCQRIWVYYAVSSAGSPDATKWYKGIVSKKERLQITPENALEHLESLEWYVYGGEFSENTPTFGSGNINPA